jgi:hypothetical protein
METLVSLSSETFGTEGALAAASTPSFLIRGLTIQRRFGKSIQTNSFNCF